MADTNSTSEILKNPLIGLYPEDTLQACSQILVFLSCYTLEDCPSEDEIQGLANIQYVVKKALDYEIGRVGQLRKDTSAS